LKTQLHRGLSQPIQKTRRQKKNKKTEKKTKTKTKTKTKKKKTKHSNAAETAYKQQTACRAENNTTSKPPPKVF
jgi:hypothetical protein